MLKQCEYCGADYQVRPCLYAAKKYCSVACANQARQVTIVCAYCGKSSAMPRSKTQRRFCNKACNDAYRAAHAIAKECICKVCGIQFKTYEARANTCSQTCRDIYEHKELRCLCCGKSFRVKRSHATKKRYCSKECMAEAYKQTLIGKANPNYRNRLMEKACCQCGGVIETRNPNQKYCSRECYTMSRHYRPVQIDLNQSEIVGALKDVGASIIDTSGVGNGFPDLIVGFRGANYLLEVKNRKTNYGRKGLNKNQIAWAESWHGTPPIVVYSIDDALKAIGVIE